MPKPNGYYYYMQTMRNEKPHWRNKGNGELSQLCSEGWNRLTAQEKKVYNDMKHSSGIVLPKPGKKLVGGTEKGETDLGGQDSLGRSLLEIHLSAEAAVKKREEEAKFCSDIAENIIDTDKFMKEFYVISTTNYCITEEMENKVYVPAEVSIGVFSLSNGVNKFKKMNVFCKPVIPFGFTLMVKTACEKLLKVPYPFEDALPYEEVANIINNFVQENIINGKNEASGVKVNNAWTRNNLTNEKAQNRNVVANEKPQKVIIFTHPKYRDTCEKNLAVIFGGAHNVPFKVMSLADIVVGFFNIKTEYDKMTCTAMGDYLDHKRRQMDFKDRYCDHHEKEDAPECTTAILTKWIRSSLEILGSAGYKVKISEKINKPKSTVPDNFKW